MFKGYALGFITGLEDEDVDVLVGILESLGDGYTAGELEVAQRWLTILRPGG